MDNIKLPISKSIANRILLLQAIHGDPLLRVSSEMPDDVLVLHDALEKIREVYGVPGSLPLREGVGLGLSLNLKNCGTALRFLQVHLQYCYKGEPIVLDGDPRLRERDGKPTSQTTSAKILHGETIPVEKDESPYITMSRRMAETYPNIPLERDWSAAAFWYEYVAIHGGSLFLDGLCKDSLQGDRIVADLYATHFGVQTTFTPEGAKIKKSQISTALPIDRNLKSQIAIDFVNCIDLYPAIALTCERLGITLIATGTDRLRFKECDRIEAVAKHEVRNDHRMAMALMCADFPVSIEEQACIAKSYPNFVPQHITPIKGVNDDNLGKKHALSKLIHAATSEYVWLHDDDIVLPPATKKAVVLEGDLIILPLRMESLSQKPSFLETLQMVEYTAIQALTMRTAKRGRAVMCSGANLIVRREAWLACEPDLHPEIPSGDDMFLLEAMKHRGYKISVIDTPDFTAVVRPLTSWRAFFRQRMRWAGKAPQYTDPDILRCGAWVLIANMIQLLFPPFILIKFPIEYSLIRSHFLVSLLLAILYPYYILVCLLGGLFRKHKW